MPPSHSDRHSVDLEWICHSALKATFPAFRGIDIEACFYPYVGFTHTIRRRGPKWILRISDHCRHAPRAVLESIAILLACKVLRRKPPAEMLEIYERYRHDSVVEDAVRARRVARGQKQIGNSDGKHHSLREILEETNRRYFNGQMEISRIGWGLRRSWDRLGHYDCDHNTITVSPVLDSPEVPRRVVAYIVYHELLHAIFEKTPTQGRNRYHSREFRRAERAYPDYSTAKKFLKSFSANR